jgi:hypothetical protein
MHYVLLVLSIASIVLLLFSMIYVPILHWRVREEKTSITIALRNEFMSYFVAFISMFAASAISRMPSELSFLAWVKSSLLILIVSLTFAGILTWVSYRLFLRWRKNKSATIIGHN